MGDVTPLPQRPDDGSEGDDEAVISLRIGDRCYQLTLTPDEAEELLSRLDDRR